MDKVCLIGAYAAVAIITLGSLAAEVPWQCPPGYVLNPARNGCLECGDGRFMDRFNREESCWHCLICSGGRMTVSPCNSSVNTVCVCPDDHYENSEGCTPKGGFSIADSCTVLLDKIEKSIDALRQTLNGTAEQQLLGDVLSQVRTVEGSLASASTEDSGPPSKRNQVGTVITDLTGGSPLATQVLQTTLLVVVLLRPLWKVMKSIYYKLNVMKSLYYQFIKRRPKDSSTANNYTLFMDHVEHSVESVRQSLNNKTTAIVLQCVLGDVRSVRCILDSALTQANASSCPEPIVPDTNHADETADPVAENCIFLLEQIEKSVKRVRRSLNDQLNSDLLEVALTEVRIVKRKMASAHIQGPYYMRMFFSWKSRLFQCCGRHWRNSAPTNDAGATNGEAPATPTASTTDEAQITIAAEAVAASASETSLSSKESAVRLSKSMVEYRTQTGNNANQLCETDDSKEEPDQGCFRRTMFWKTRNPVTKATGATREEIPATLASSATDEAQIAEARGTDKSSAVEPSLCTPESTTKA